MSQEPVIKSSVNCISCTKERRSRPRRTGDRLLTGESGTGRRSLGDRRVGLTQGSIASLPEPRRPDTLSRRATDGSAGYAPSLAHRVSRNSPWLVPPHTNPTREFWCCAFGTWPRRGRQMRQSPLAIRPICLIRPIGPINCGGRQFPGRCPGLNRGLPLRGGQNSATPKRASEGRWPKSVRVTPPVPSLARRVGMGASVALVVYFLPVAVPREIL